MNIYVRVDNIYGALISISGLIFIPWETYLEGRFALRKEGALYAY